MHCIPTVLTPVLPVLHEDVNRKFAAAEFRSGIEYLLLARVAFAALPESICPARQQWRATREFPILSDDIFRFRPIKEVVVHRLGCLRAKSHGVRGGASEHLGISP